MSKYESNGRWIAVIAILMMGLILAACQPGAAPTEEPQNEQNRPAGTATGATGSTGGGDDFAMPEATEEAEAQEYGPAVGEAEEPDRAAGDGVVPPNDSAAGGAASEPGLPSATQAVVQQPPIAVPPDEQLQPLQAGEINDNEEFEAYLQYRLDYFDFVNWPVQDLDVSERYIIRVMTANSRPVLGADVNIYTGQNLITSLHTPATGLVYFFPRAYRGTSNASSFDVVVERDQTEQAFSIERSGNALYDVRLDVSATQPSVALDVLFLIDSTGSMGDEIDELKNNILSISAQVAALPSQPDVRFGMVTYRDHNDSYVVRNSDFTRNVQDFQQVLMNVFAGGGGDDPEALQEALANAIHNVDWRGGETVQLIFLVADAPPHLDYEQDYPYSQSLLEAASMGIKIQPVASRLCERGRDTCSSERRGYSEQAEYIFRQMAQFTGGSFIFLTYEDTPQGSGEPGSDTHVDEQSFSVQDLDALVVRLITNELAALEGGQQ